MNPITQSNTSLYLDGKPFQVTETSTWKTFEDICSFYSDHLNPEGRAILRVTMDGIEVDCSTPPSHGHLQAVKKIEVESCLFEDLIKITLDDQIKTTQSLSATILELSTDCLIQTPLDTFENWKKALETLKALVGFVPKFFSLQPFANPIPDEVNEENLTKHIHNIQEAVEISRKAWEIQDVVLFSDTLELNIVGWLKTHEAIAQKLRQAISVQAI